MQSTHTHTTTHTTSRTHTQPHTGLDCVKVKCLRGVLMNNQSQCCCWGTRPKQIRTWDRETTESHGHSEQSTQSQRFCIEDLDVKSAGVGLYLRDCYPVLCTSSMFLCGRLCLAGSDDPGWSSSSGPQQDQDVCPPWPQRSTLRSG